MSTSLTWTLTVICERSAIWMRPPAFAAESVEAPTCAFMATTEPPLGARTVRFSAFATAML